MAEAVIWGIHAGKTGDADALFLQGNYVAIGWDPMGDLAAIAPNRDAFKAKVEQVFPDKKPGAIPGIAGQSFRFAHEMKVGDVLAYPSRASRQIHLGHVTSAYRHDPQVSAGYPNLRGAKWVTSLPRTKFSQGALYEIGSAMSLFQIKNHADEYLAALANKAVPVPVASDETVAEVAHEVQESTEDFILKTLAQDLKGHPFADFVAHLLTTMGYRTRVSPPGPDGGVDIVAHKDELGFEPPIIKVQVKSTEGKVGDPEVSSLYGKVGPNEHGLLVTLGTFTTQALNFGKTKSNLRLIDGADLVALVLAHYDQFDSRYKGILPLRRVYIPESRIKEG